MSPPFWALGLGALSGLALFIAFWSRHRRPTPPTSVSVHLPSRIEVRVVTEARPPPTPPEEIQFAPAVRQHDPDALTQPLIKRPKEEDPQKTVAVRRGDEVDRAITAEREKMRNNRR